MNYFQKHCYRSRLITQQPLFWVLGTYPLTMSNCNLNYLNNIKSVYNNLIATCVYNGKGNESLKSYGEWDGGSRYTFCFIYNNMEYL